MLAGEFYNALDPEIVAARNKARGLLQRLNATHEEELDLRQKILIELFSTGGESVWMQPPFYCDYGFNIRLGNKCYFNFNCVILDVCPVEIGDYVFFGPSVQVYTALHPMDAKLRREQEYGKSVQIGSDVWIGGSAIICPGVKIGSRTVIGAGSVVTKDIPDDVFAAGNPCRVIRQVTASERL